MLMEDATSAMLLDADINPLTDWNFVYNLSSNLEYNTRIFCIDMAIIGEIDRFQEAVMQRPAFSNLSVLVRRRSSNYDYYVFKNCVFQVFQSMSLDNDEMGQLKMTFLCNLYETHTDARVQIIRPIGSQQSRPQVNPNRGIENRLRNLGNRNPDCGRDSDGPVDWLSNGF